MAHEIQRARVRDDLPQRPYEPYWRTLERGRALGFRKVGDDKGYWIARMRPDESSAKYEYEPLGEAKTAFGWDEAKAAAEAWFRLRTEGVKTDEVQIVEAACRAYVNERRTSKGEDCAHDAEKRFERTVYGKAFGAQRLEKLRAATVREWRDSLDLKPAAASRTLTALKAAINLAVREKHAPAALALELRLVKPLPGGKRRRDLFLDRSQRRKLLSVTKGALHDLIEGIALTGARAGELIKATVSQFDAHSKSMTFISGKGNDGPRSRTVPLSPPAAALLKRLAAGKAATDRLFTRDDGQSWAHSDWDESVREAAKAAELPSEPRTGVCLYTFRHCFITEALLGGMPTLEVARLVGTSVAMIEKHYGHLVASAARKRLAKVAML
ncbi:MAG TPA: tyrosine-type recombinase/integrase [Steroidobacteraceae bacterium]|jgi:integrase